MSKENSKETQQNKKLLYHTQKVSKFFHQDNFKNINLNKEANNKIRTNNKDRNKIKEKFPIYSIRKVTGKISYERDQINFDSKNTKKDNNKKDSEKEKSGKKKLYIYSRRYFQININNNDDNNISKTSNNIESDTFDNFI